MEIAGPTTLRTSGERAARIQDLTLSTGTFPFRATAAAVALVLAGCVAPGADPLADRGADGLPTGDRLWIEAAGKDPTPPAGALDPADPDAPPPADTAYTVRPGDSLGAIARRLTGDPDDWRDIARANGIEDPSELAVGTVLTVPAALLDGAGPTGPSGAAGDGRVGLVDALGLAQAHDATFRIAREQFDVARAGVPLARSGLLPQAGLQAEYGRFFDLGGDDPGPAGAGVGVGTDATGAGVVPLADDDYDELQLSASISQALFDRAASLSLRRARLETDVAETRLLAAHEELVVRVARAYFDVLRAASNLEFRESDLDAIRRQLQQSERRYEVGDIAITDVVEARARRDLAEAAQIAAGNEVSDAREALSEITGLDGDAFDLARLDDDFELLRPDPDDVEAWVERALSDNAELIAATGTAESATEAVGVTRAGRLPTVSVGASVVSVDSDGPRGDSDVGNVAITGSLPLLSGGRVTAQIAQAQAQARLAQEQRVDTERRVVRGTRNAYRGVIASLAQVRALRQALASTRQASRATEAGFQAGTRTSVEVLESLRDLFSAQAEYASARYAYIVGTLELERTAGTLDADDVARVGGWLEER